MNHKVIRQFTASEFAVDRPASRTFGPGEILVTLEHPDDTQVKFASLEEMIEEFAEGGGSLGEPTLRAQRPYITTRSLFAESTEAV